MRGTERGASHESKLLESDPRENQECCVEKHNGETISVLVDFVERILHEYEPLIRFPIDGHYRTENTLSFEGAHTVRDAMKSQPGTRFNRAIVFLRKLANGR
jgi:hypothetical protein